SMKGFELPQMKGMMFTAASVAMDDTYLSAVGYRAPSPIEKHAVRSVLFTLGHVVEGLPYTPFLRSLQNNPARGGYMRPGQLGVGARSEHMPAVDRAKANGGFPEEQRPILESSDIRPMDLPVLAWDEIRTHTTA